MTESELRALWLSNLLLDRHVYRLPVDPLRIARAYNIRIRSASDYLRAGMSEESLFAVWGNEDGSAMLAHGFLLLNYNDRKTIHRQRFTIAEELCHILLGHVRDPRFNVYSQEYDPGLYATYEHEAKTAAGLLLMPPSLYLRLIPGYPLSELAAACQISHDCARTTAAYIDRNADELRERATQKYIDLDFRSLRRRRIYAISVSA